MSEKVKRPQSDTFGVIDRKILAAERHWGWTFGIVAALLTIILVAFARAFLFQTFKIPSASMVPALQIGDHIIVNKFVYGTVFGGSNERYWQVRKPRAGDVVVFYRFSEFEDRDNNTHYIKRIGAVPGDIVEVKDYRTFINGRAYGLADQRFVGLETQLESNLGKDLGPLTLRSDEYFVLGDNQANSRDSRFYGPIHFADIEGKAEMIYWSWNTAGESTKVRWERVGKYIR